MDESAAHRHDTVEKRPCEKASTCASSAKQSAVDKRLTPKRNMRSSKFLRSLQIAKSCQNSFRVVDIKVNSSHCHEVLIIHNTGTSYKVTLDKMPNCNGCKYCTTQDICIHILWILLYVYKISETSELYQRSFLDSELESIMKGCHAKLATVNTVTTGTANAVTPKAAKDFRNPDYRKPQWCVPSSDFKRSNSYLFQSKMLQTIRKRRIFQFKCQHAGFHPMELRTERNLPLIATTTFACSGPACKAPLLTVTFRCHLVQSN